MKDKDYGKFVIEPLERECSTTLGNSLVVYFLLLFKGSCSSIDIIYELFNSGVREERDANHSEH